MPGFRVVAFWLDAPPRQAIARNATREGRERIPVRGILGTYKRLEAPSLAEGFEAVFRVRSESGQRFVLQLLEPRRLSAWPPGNPAAMASKSNTTTDHDEIRRWVEEHDGTPASVRDTGDGDDAGVLRIDFPGGAGEDELERISWDEWFEKFDGSNLAFLCQEEKASGEDSTFFKLVSRD